MKSDAYKEFADKYLAKRPKPILIHEQSIKGITYKIAYVDTNDTLKELYLFSNESGTMAGFTAMK